MFLTIVFTICRRLTLARPMLIFLFLVSWRSNTAIFWAKRGSARQAHKSEHGAGQMKWEYFLFPNLDSWAIVFQKLPTTLISLANWKTIIEEIEGLWSDCMFSTFSKLWYRQFLIAFYFTAQFLKYTRKLLSRETSTLMTLNRWEEALLQGNNQSVTKCYLY